MEQKANQTTDGKSVLAVSTVDSEQQAISIANHLVAHKAAACVNIVPGVRSIYRWQGSIESGQEWLLLIKTTEGRVPFLQEELRAVHHYEVPELIVIPIESGLPAYLAWIAESVQ